MKAKFNRIDSHVFNGRRYRIIWRRPRNETTCSGCGRLINKQSDGGCDPPDGHDKCIMIGPKLDEPVLLETAIHESLHALLWLVDEQAIDVTARDIASFIRRIGFHL